MSAQLPTRVFDAHLLFNQATEFDQPQVGVPDAIVNLFGLNVFTGTAGTGIHLVAIPADAAFIADIGRLVVRGIFQLQQLFRVESEARLVVREVTTF
jgi:hypothetical protein